MSHKTLIGKEVNLFFLYSDDIQFLNPLVLQLVSLHFLVRLIALHAFSFIRLKYSAKGALRD